MAPGDVIRIDPSANRTFIASGLFLPTAMTFGPDGALRFERRLWATTERPGAGSKNHSAVAAEPVRLSDIASSSKR